LVPQILVIHDTIPLLYPEESPRLHKYYKLLLPRLVRHASFLVTVSDASKRDLIKHYGIAAEKICLAHESARGSFSDPANERKPDGLDREAFFLFVGGFSPRKNLATVIQGFAKARLKVRESLIIVAYPDRWMPQIIQNIEELGISDRVLFLNDLQFAELNYVYRRATALFLLSEYEGFGLPALEAMLVGTPAVVSDTPALAEVVSDAAIKIKAHDTHAVAELMCRLSLEPEFRAGWKEKGLERARTFTWHRTGECLRELLQQFS
jgi:glycosyltransferase involved in cell wall biosynthesis